MSLNWNESKQRGEMIPLEKAQPGQSINPNDRIFLDTTAVAPSPSRDYYRLLVTKHSVTLTHWKISHGGRSSTAAASAHETKAELGNFSPQKNIELIAEVGRVFGNTYVDYIFAVSEGRYDWILTLPNSILVKIIAHTGIENLSIIASTCQRFHQICEDDELWAIFYRQFSGKSETKITTARIRQASYFSWKNLFLVNRIQDFAFPGKRVQLGPFPSVEDLEPKLQKVQLVKEDKMKKRNPSKSRSKVNKTGRSSSKPQKDSSAEVQGKLPEKYSLPNIQVVTRDSSQLMREYASSRLMNAFHGLPNSDKFKSGFKNKTKVRNNLDFFNDDVALSATTLQVHRTSSGIERKPYPPQRLAKKYE